MKFKKSIKLLFFILTLFYFNNIFAKINNNIVVKVGTEIITSLDVENEIKTQILISKNKISQETINAFKNNAIEALIRKSLKSNEIDKYKITRFSKADLNDYLERLSKNFNTDINGIKELFKNNNVNYQNFVNAYKVELLWNTLIFKLYKNQIAINPLEIENDLRKTLKDQENIKEFNLSEIELNANDPGIDKILNLVYQKIKNESFETAVKDFSISTTALKDGKLGWLSNNSLSNIYREQLNTTKKGELTNPIRNSETLTILKVNDIKLIKNEDIDLIKIKTSVINRKKNQKLKLFSRSHFTNLENSVLINFYD